MGEGFRLRLSSGPFEVSRPAAPAASGHAQQCRAVANSVGASVAAGEGRADIAGTDTIMASFGKIFHPLAITALLLLVIPVTACGGSSSETPPPLEPDPHALPPRPLAARPAPPRGASDDDLEPTSPRARGTWGTGRVRAVAPADAGIR
jgi:hypothetical protein